MANSLTKEIAAELLGRIGRETPEEAIADMKFDYPEREVKSAVYFLLEFLAAHTYMPSFKYQIGVE